MEKRQTRIVSFGVFWGVVAFLSLIGGTRVYADGKYFPKRAYKTAPAIPAQRAILVFREGVEKLIIESDLEGEGKEFAWVIPLPARPTDFEEASPGLFKTFSLNIQPKITHDLRGLLASFIVLAILVTLGCLFSISKKHTSRIAELLIILSVLILFMSMAMPTLGVRGVQFVRAGKDRGVTVHEFREVGSYQLSVLEADNADFLSRWLDGNGFTALTAEEKPVITDYIRDGFCFVAARLRREGDGYSRPHPLAMTFPCKTPMYPMRLTGTVGSDVYLELFVVADKHAHCQNLTVEVSDTFDFEESAVRAFGDREALSGFVGSRYTQHIGHPDASAHLWDGCIVSRLAGRLGPDEMKDDLSIQLNLGQPQRKHFYTEVGALQLACSIFLGIWSVFLPASIMVLARKIGRGPAREAIGIRIFGLVAVIGAFTSSAVYLLVPTVSAKILDGPGLPPSLMDFVARNRMLEDKEALAEEYDYFEGKSREEIAGIVEDYFSSEDCKNPYTGEPIEEEDSPGNYTIIEDERGVVCTTYSLSGYPDEFVLTERPKD